MSGTSLKWIAVISMLIDHTAEVLMNHNAALTAPIWAQIYVLMRGIGRIAFPIYAFLLVEGFLHTRDVKKYLTRMFLFAVVSEVPFDLAVFHTPFYWGYQNVFFALFLGLLALAGIRWGASDGLESSQLVQGQSAESRSAQDSVMHGKKAAYQNGEMFVGAGLWKQAIALILCVGAAQLINCDYGAFGVFFIVLLYMTRFDPKTQTVLGALSLIWERPGILAFIPIRLYNGTRGRCGNKYFFYAFYPAHLLALWCIGRVAFKLF